MKKIFTVGALFVTCSLLSACGGGGTTSSNLSSGGGASATPISNIMFSSSYLAYPAVTNGAFLTSIQGGDVYTGFGGNYVYGQFSSSQHDANYERAYRLQITDNGTAPITANDYSYISFTAPGTNSGNYGSVDISNAQNLVIEMGNTYRPSYTANVFTITLSNQKGATPATETCNYDQTLNNGSTTGLSQNGIFTYVIPLSSFSCTGIASASAITDLTSVAVKVIGNKNTSVTVGNYQVISVGSISFTGALPNVTTNVSADLAL